MELSNLRLSTSSRFNWAEWDLSRIRPFMILFELLSFLLSLVFLVLILIQFGGAQCYDPVEILFMILATLSFTLGATVLYYDFQMTFLNSWSPLILWIYAFSKTVQMCMVGVLLVIHSGTVRTTQSCRTLVSVEALQFVLITFVLLTITFVYWKRHQEILKMVNLPRNSNAHSQYVEERFRWKPGDLLGTGATSSVYLALNLCTGRLMAVKRIKKDYIENVQKLEREIEMHKSLNHKMIVRYYGTEQEEHFLNIFLEFVSGGSISSLLKKFGHFEEALIRKFVRQILTALTYLHKLGIVHGDIKGANILVSQEGVCKVADFGASRRIKKNPDSSMMKLHGTPHYMAPEVIEQEPQNTPEDIWALGMTVVEMAQGHPFWHKLKNPAQIVFKIKENHPFPPLPKMLSAEAKDFLTACLQRDPGDRPTASALLKHPFIASEPSHWVKVSKQKDDSLLIDAIPSPLAQKNTCKSTNTFDSRSMFGYDNTSEYYTDSSSVSTEMSTVSNYSHSSEGVRRNARSNSKLSLGSNSVRKEDTEEKEGELERQDEELEERRSCSSSVVGDVSQSSSYNELHTIEIKEEKELPSIQKIRDGGGTPAGEASVLQWLEENTQSVFERTMNWITGAGSDPTSDIWARGLEEIAPPYDVRNYKADSEHEGLDERLLS